MIQLAEHAEAYIQHQQRQRQERGTNDSLSERYYDDQSSREEWANSFAD